MGGRGELRPLHASCLADQMPRADLVLPGVGGGAEREGGLAVGRQFLWLLCKSKIKSFYFLYYNFIICKTDKEQLFNSLPIIFLYVHLTTTSVPLTVLFIDIHSLSR